MMSGTIVGKKLHPHPQHNEKILLLPLTLTLTFFGTVAEAQFLGPLPEDTVGFIEVDFEGGAIAFDGDLAGGILIYDIPAFDFSGVNPFSPYTWCFEVALPHSFIKSRCDEEQGEVCKQARERNILVSLH